MWDDVTVCPLCVVTVCFTAELLFGASWVLSCIFILIYSTCVFALQPNLTTILMIPLLFIRAVSANSDGVRTFMFALCSRTDIFLFDLFFHTSAIFRVAGGVFIPAPALFQPFFFFHSSPSLHQKACSPAHSRPPSPFFFHIDKKKQQKKKRKSPN